MFLNSNNFEGAYRKWVKFNIKFLIKKICNLAFYWNIRNAKSIYNFFPRPNPHFKGPIEGAKPKNISKIRFLESLNLFLRLF